MEDNTYKTIEDLLIEELRATQAMMLHMEHVIGLAPMYRLEKVEDEEAYLSDINKLKAYENKVRLAMDELKRVKYL